MPHSAAMLHSVLAHAADRDVRVHYLHGPSLPAGDRERLAQMTARQGGEVSFREVPEGLVRGLPTEGFTLEATWYRIFLPDLLPDVDRILFLDADLLALQPLTPLWETDISEHYLAAVTNVFQADHLFRAEQLGFDRPDTYFNAGVMLLNLDLMRRDGCAAAMRDYGVAHSGELMFRDQDVLNAVLAGRRLSLHPRWNCMNSFREFPVGRVRVRQRGAAGSQERPRDQALRGPRAQQALAQGVLGRPAGAVLRGAPPDAVAGGGDGGGGGAPAPLPRRIARRVRRRLRA